MVWGGRYSRLDLTRCQYPHSIRGGVSISTMELAVHYCLCLRFDNSVRYCTLIYTHDEDTNIFVIRVSAIVSFSHVDRPPARSTLFHTEALVGSTFDLEANN